MECLAGCFGGPQLGLKAPKKFTYFALATPVGLPSQLLLNLTNTGCEQVAVQFSDWDALKPKTPNGQLPYADMPDGSAIFDSGAIGRTIAGAAGLLGTGKEYSVSEQLVGLTTDINKKVFEITPTVMNVQDFGPAKKKAFIEGKPAVLTMMKGYEKSLLPAGDRFTKAGTSFGEVDLFAKLYCWSNGPIPEASQGALKPFYDRMANTPGVKKVLDGTSGFGKLQLYMLPGQ
jgi:glutathione S-transferase